jgi:hypothetical protein
MLASAAVVLPLGFVVELGGVASAARSNTTGTGTVTCKKIKGKITFNPPLVNGGTAAETASVTASATKCKNSKGGGPKVKKISVVSSIASANNSCTGLASAAPPALTLTYTPASISASSVSGGTLTFGTTPTLNFVISGESTAGSFPTTGTTSTKAVTTETSTAFGTACAGSGVASLTIKSGTGTDI